MTRETLSPREYLEEHCDACDGRGARAGRYCSTCAGTGRRLRHTHSPASAIDAEPDGFAELFERGKRVRAFLSPAPPEPADCSRAARPASARLVPVAILHRAVQLSRLLRGPENSEPLNELLDLVEEAARD